MFAYGPADATAIPEPHRFLPHLHPDWFCLSGTGLPRLSGKRGWPLNGCSSSSSNSKLLVGLLLCRFDVCLSVYLTVNVVQVCRCTCGRTRTSSACSCSDYAALSRGSLVSHRCGSSHPLCSLSTPLPAKPRPSPLVRRPITAQQSRPAPANQETAVGRNRGGRDVWMCE